MLINAVLSGALMWAAYAGVQGPKAEIRYVLPHQSFIKGLIGKLSGKHRMGYASVIVNGVEVLHAPLRKDDIEYIIEFKGGSLDEY